MQNNKYILILGAKSGIGIAVAHEYAKHGYNIYLAGRNTEIIENDVADLKIRYKVEAQAFEFDVLNYDSHEEFYNQLDPKPFGIIMVLGYLGDHERALKDFSESTRILETNFNGCVYFINIVSNDLEQRKEGFIIGISSIAGDRGKKRNYLYGSAKAGFTVYLSGLRNRLYGSGVHVLTVKPGYVNTKMIEGKNLPSIITGEPESVARDIFKAQRRGKNVLYTRWYWKWIMLIIKNIPERIFKKKNF